MTTATETAIARLLLERGAQGIEHPGGTLDDHLARVQQRLAQLGAPQEVQLAARAHAVYGTDGFDVALLSLEERTVLAGVIGEDAEQLVYRYGACDRKRTWEHLAEHSADFLDRYGSYFRRLTTAWAPMLSAAVLADARRVFG